MSSNKMHVIITRKGEVIVDQILINVDHIPSAIMTVCQLVSDCILTVKFL